MLKDPPVKYYKYDTLSKAKYQLKVYKSILYSFVTTSIPEEDCINVLKERAYFHRKNRTVYYDVLKIQNGETTIIYKGIVPPFD